MSLYHGRPAERLHRIEGRKIKESDAAVFWSADSGRQDWWPKSQIVEQTRDCLVVTDWIYNEKGY